MKKAIIIATSALILGAAIAVGVWYYGQEEITAQAPKEIGKFQTSNISEKGATSPLNLNFRNDASDVLRIMNQMTHQKVVAADKWGAIPMTVENINDVYDHVESSSYDEKEDLLKILAKWKAGDFSEVDKDHNKVLKLQGGNVGHAHDILSPEDEKLFIDNNFKHSDQVE